jgi:hypothetical protein
MGLGALAHGSHGTQRDGPELVVPLGLGPTPPKVGCPRQLEVGCPRQLEMAPMAPEGARNRQVVRQLEPRPRCPPPNLI